MLVCLGALTQPAPAEAFTCFRTASESLLEIHAGGNEHVTIKRSGVNFHISSEDTDATHCGATVNNVDTVEIDAAGGAERITLDLSNGQFAPGATAEGSGTSEIEFTSDPDNCINCQFNSGDRFEIVGGSGAENIRFFDDDAIMLNGDNDFDVSLLNPHRRLLVDGNGGADYVHGGSGIFAHTTPMLITGGTGSDDLTASDGSDLLRAEEGNDTVHGGDGPDGIDGAAGDDLLFGDAGNDQFEPLGETPDGADSLSGGLGEDQVRYVTRDAPVHLSLNGVADDGEEGEGDNLGSVEKLGGGTADDVLIGDDTANQLDGDQGNDQITGMGGADTELGGIGLGDDTFLQGPVPDGADTIVGGFGTDSVDYSQRTEGVTATLDGADGGEGDQLTAEHLIGGAGDDTLGGSEGANTLTGAGGDDILAGGPGVASDRLDGGGGEDTADYSARSDEVAISLDGTANDGASAEGDNALTENATGGSAGDDITGGAGRNRLLGGGGEDTLSGGDGADAIGGGAGEDDEFGNAGGDRFLQGVADDGGDELFGGSGGDAVDYSQRTEAVTVSFNGLPDDGGPVENDDIGEDVEDAVGGAGADNLIGDPAENRLVGGSGADELTGLKGDDRLFGGDGPDKLNGGKGTDLCDGGRAKDRLTDCERR